MRQESMTTTEKGQSSQDINCYKYPSRVGACAALTCSDVAGTYFHGAAAGVFECGVPR